MELLSQIFNKYLHDKWLLFMKLNIQAIQIPIKVYFAFFDTQAKSIHNFWFTKQKVQLKHKLKELCTEI